MISVIIVNYNVRYFVEQTVRSVLQSNCSDSVEIIIVDNASADESVDYLKRQLPSDIKIIANQENLGFAKANNLALEQAKGDFVLFLNPDTIIGDNVLDTMAAFLRKHPKAGAAGACMIGANGEFAPESRRALPSPFVSFCKMSGLQSLFPKSRIFGRYYMKFLDKEKQNRIDVISGACLFMRKDLALQLNGFDTTYFMYGEDIDLSYRILKSGFQNWYLPVRILHYKGESTSKSSYRYVKTFYDAMIIFYRKHYKGYNHILSAAIYMTIFAKGVMTFINNNILQSLHVLKKNTQKLGVVIVCTETESHVISQILSFNPYFEYVKYIPTNYPELFVNGGILTDIDTKKYNHIIFSTDLFSYSDILSTLYSGKSKALSLGTYNSNNGSPFILLHNGTILE